MKSVASYSQDQSQDHSGPGNGNPTPYIWKIHLKMELTSEASDEWHHAANGILKINSNNNISGVLNSSRDYLGNAAIYPTHGEIKDDVRGSYDAENRKLHLEVYSNNSTTLYIYDLFLTADNKVKGEGKVKIGNEDMSRAVPGNYRFSKAVIPVHISGEKDARLIGRWHVNNLSKEDLPQIFTNQYLEFFDDGFGVSRNDNSNTINNIKLFNWNTSDNNILNISGTNYSFIVNNNVVTLKTAFSNDNQEKNNIQKTVIVTLKKISVNPFINYRNDLSMPDATGNYLLGIQFDNTVAYYAADSLYDYFNIFYDLHAFTNELGEVVMYRFPDETKQLPFDSLRFMKYSLQTANPGADRQGSLYLFEGLNVTLQQKFYCHFSDGVVILKDSEGTLYLIKINDANWSDLGQLHNAYNKYYFSHILPPPHTHWEKCTYCFGKGTMDEGLDYSKPIYDGHDVIGYDRKYGDCPKCLARAVFI